MSTWSLRTRKHRLDRDIDQSTEYTARDIDTHSNGHNMISTDTKSPISHCYLPGLVGMMGEKVIGALQAVNEAAKE